MTGCKTERKKRRHMARRRSTLSNAICLERESLNRATARSVKSPLFISIHTNDAQLYLLKLPNFLEIDPKAFTLANFRPPTTDHRSKTTPSATFSAYSTAMGTIRWRHSPSNPEELQSNARVLRWSDGSLTLQLASEPMIQYELPSNPLAPPQINPKKPTPTAMTDKRNKSQQHHYNAGKDSFTYLATPHPDHAIMRFTNKLTTGLSVVPPAGAAATDDALERLQETMAAAQRAKEQLADGGMIIDKEMLEDPELAKKRAEQAEKEKMRAQRRSETQISRERERTGRTLGRAGVRTGGGGGGLTVGGLEDDEAGGAAGGRYAGGRPSKPKKRRPLRDEYSDEDDYAGRRRTKEDEYDEEDDFIAGSEEEIVEEDSEEDMDERIERQQHERERVREGSGTPKRSRQASAEGEGPPQASPKATKRRRIIDDDDDE